MPPAPSRLPVAEGRADKAAAPDRSAVRGIERMVTDDGYCIDILTWVGGVTTALESLGSRSSTSMSSTASPARSLPATRPRHRRRAEPLEAVHRFAKTR